MTKPAIAENSSGEDEPLLRNGKPLCGAPRTGRSDSGPGRCNNYAGMGTEHLGYGHCKFHMGNTPTQNTRAVRMMVEARRVAYGTPITVDPMTALLLEVHRTAGHIAWVNLQLQEHPDPLEVEARVLLNLYTREREHLVRVSKAALDAGVGERQVRIAEQQGALLIGVIDRVLRQLNLTPIQMQAARLTTAKELRAVVELDEAPA